MKPRPTAKQIVANAKKVGLIGVAGPVNLPPFRPVKSDGRVGKRILRGAYHKRYVMTLPELIAKYPHLQIPHAE